MPYLVEGKSPNHVTGVSPKVLMSVGLRALAFCFTAFPPKRADVTKMVFDGLLPLLCS